tara:strand:+ start:1997 stop:2596 length:600 start_codon:yes stop_codon:yes gene_type:complete
MPKIVDHRARRLEISEAAAALIANSGLQSVTIREVAKASGYSKGVIEHYFESREALLSGALMWANTCYEKRVAKATAGLSGIASVRKRIESTLPVNKKVRNEWKVRLVFWSMAAIDPVYRRQQEERFQKAVQHFADDIQLAITAGDIAAGEADVIARRLVNTITGISTAALHNLSLYNKALLLDEVDHIIAGLSPRGGS